MAKRLSDCGDGGHRHDNNSFHNLDVEMRGFAEAATSVAIATATQGEFARQLDPVQATYWEKPWKLKAWELV